MWCYNFLRPVWCLRIWIGGLWWFLGLSSSAAQQTDTLYLLHNKQLQYSVTAAMDSMYNFKFEHASVRYHWLRQEYPRHPLPYFLVGLNAWWQLMPNTNDKTYDPIFLNYMDTAAYFANRIMKRGQRTEGAFLLSVTYAFLGRFYGERDSWLKAAWAGRNALKYLRISQEKDYLHLENMLGDALYNYYSVWIRENYPQLKLLLTFFKNGDQALGLQQLDYVAKNSFYTRVEAQFFLMRILNEENVDKKEALHIAKYLHEHYPDNAYFHRYYARVLYETGDYVRCKEVSEELFQRIAAQAVGYENNTGRYATFFLAWIHQKIRQEPQIAQEYYQQSLRFAEAAHALHMGYSLHAWLSLGDIAAEQKRYAEAATYYKQIQKHAKRKNKTWKEAKKRYKALPKRKSST